MVIRKGMSFRWVVPNGSGKIYGVVPDATDHWCGIHRSSKRRFVEERGRQVLSF